MGELAKDGLIDPAALRERRLPASAGRRETFERILDAAHHTVLDEGMARLKIGSVAARAGLERTDLDQFFSSRAGIITALMDRGIEQMDRFALEQVLALKDPTLQSVIETTMRSVHRALVKDPVFAEIFLRNRTLPYVWLRGEEHASYLAAILLAHCRSLGIVSDDLTEKITTFVVLMGDRIFQVAFQGDDGDQQMVDEGIAMISAYLARYAQQP